MDQSARGMPSKPAAGVELSIENDGAMLPAPLSLPAANPIGGIVPLHPASEPSREQFLFQHLARELPARGIAVLRYDRRPTDDERDTPLEVQASDALAALRVLRSHIGEGAPVGLWGFSQGAWAAPLAAAESEEVAFLALVASTGVSPAQQMRYGVDQQARRAGFSGQALDELARLRTAYEEYLRGNVDYAAAQALVDSASSQPWFPLAWVPRELPTPGAWGDMDFDPEAIFARVRCPTLLFYGEDDEWTPADASAEAWQRAAQRAAQRANNRDLTVIRLPGASHHPTLRGEQSVEAISPLYTETLVGWLMERLARRA